MIYTGPVSQNTVSANIKVYVSFDQLPKLMCNNTGKSVALLKFDGPSFSSGLVLTLVNYDPEYVTVVKPTGNEHLPTIKTTGLEYVPPVDNSEYWSL